MYKRASELPKDPVVPPGRQRVGLVHLDPQIRPGDFVLQCAKPGLAPLDPFAHAGQLALHGQDLFELSRPLRQQAKQALLQPPQVAEPHVQIFDLFRYLTLVQADAFDFPQRPCPLDRGVEPRFRHANGHGGSPRLSGPAHLLQPLDTCLQICGDHPDPSHRRIYVLDLEGHVGAPDQETLRRHRYGLERQRLGDPGRLRRSGFVAQAQLALERRIVAGDRQQANCQDQVELSHRESHSLRTLVPY